MARKSKAKVDESTGFRGEEGDWSLRARADTYRDRREESERLSDRLARSSASVTGIAGQRGAGKSSLALRVLGERDERDVYTQLIHAPTGYEPREFLASVFQTICENVVERIDGELGQPKGLAERAADVRRRLSRMLLVWGLACSLPPLVAGGYLVVEYTTETVNQIEVGKEESRKNRIAYLTAEVAKVEKDLVGMSEELPSFEKFHERLNLLNYELDLLDGEARQAFTEGIPINMTLFLAGSTLVSYIAIFVALRSLLRVQRERRITKREPLRVGLRHLALENLEHLRFQTSHGRTSEAALSLGSVLSRTTATRSSSARPLSIPGLTAQLRLFLTRIAEVYSERAVFCLDELDKIEDPNDLDKLLRGLKGVLGQPGTHFLLTVSEDALARFANRHRGTRDMVESAFEDVVFLDRVDVDLAGSIVAEMCGVPDPWEKCAKSRGVVVVLWAFGGGVPREIKRNALICLEAGIVPTNANPTVVWDQLFRARMEDMGTWATRIGGDDESTYEFLAALDVGRTFQRDGDHCELCKARSWAREFVSDWIRFLAKIDAGIRTRDVQALRFSRAALEIVVGASAIAYVPEEEGETRWDGSVRMLSRIFEVTPSNARLGIELVSAYLQEIGMGESPEGGEGVSK